MFGDQLRPHTFPMSRQTVKFKSRLRVPGRKRRVPQMGQPGRVFQESAIHETPLPAILQDLPSTAFRTSPNGLRQSLQDIGTSLRDTNLFAQRSRTRCSHFREMFQQGPGLYPLVVDRGMRQKSTLYAPRVWTGLSDLSRCSELKTLNQTNLSY